MCDLYHVRLLDRSVKHGILLSKPISEGSCQPYDDENGETALAFLEDYDYFRLCSANCTPAQRTALPQISLELRAPAGAAARVEPCRDAAAEP